MSTSPAKKLELNPTSVGHAFAIAAVYSAMASPPRKAPEPNYDVHEIARQTVEKFIERAFLMIDEHQKQLIEDLLADELKDFAHTVRTS